MGDRIILDEGSDEFKSIKEQWLKRAKECDIYSLSTFIKELTDNYNHDYGTICHAMAIASQAAAWVMDKSSQGGITGFQAGAVMWQFIREWNYSGNKAGLGMIDYDNFLYPQYVDKFDKTISVGVWDSIKKAAQDNIKDADEKYNQYLQRSEQYKKDIATFVEKYPDYYERKEYYDPLGMGNSDQWDAETKKKESGFEFAPREPFQPINEGSPVYRHWLSIVKGIVPFGYTVKSS